MRHRWPNPGAIAYPTTQPPGFPCQITTRDTGRLHSVHAHGAFLNAQGDGNTDVADGHFHRVRHGVVQPDQSDGHSHELTTLPCGVGAPHLVGQSGAMTTFGDAAVSASMPGLPGLVRPPPPSLLPWIVGAVMVAGLVIGGVMLMRSDDE